MIRLGIDMGSNSVGWALVGFGDDGQPRRLIDAGVRVFPDGRDPQSGASLAVDRRTARSMRRRRDRFLLRRDDLMKALIRHGLMPSEKAARKALEGYDPYELRARALDEKLPLHHVGRALFHLHQRRGFKSNRKTDKGDNDAGMIKSAASRLEEQMRETGARTLGEFLARRHAERQAVRARVSGTGKDAFYDFYPTRDLVEKEFEAIWAAQAKHHKEMTEEARQDLHGIMFRQRPLRPQVPGKCALSPAADADDRDGFRAPWALPITQAFRILQEVRNLEVQEPGEPFVPLNQDQQAEVLQLLFKQNSVSFDKMRGKLGFSPQARFNLESERRDGLKGDETAKVLASAKHYGAKWRGFDMDRQMTIVDRLLHEEKEEELIAWLVSEIGVNEERAYAIANARLPQGHCRLGLRALNEVVPRMRNEGMKYHEAAIDAFGRHTEEITGEVFDELPYYGEVLHEHVSGTGDPGDGVEVRYGRLPNPTVHIGLNQLRRLVNGIIREHGAPNQIVVELTRELKLSLEQKKKRDQEQTRNQERNDERRAELAKLGQDDNARNRLMLRLWEELNPDDPFDRRCPFTGEVISINRLFSGEVEIEHILPFGATLDDSAANKVVCMRFANRAKANRAPYDAFGNSPTIQGFHYDWEAISERAQNLPHNKSWRFAPDAMSRFDEMGGFIARQLTDTAYLARLTRKYMTYVSGPNNVWVIPGRLTAMLRAKWGLNSLLPDHNLPRDPNEKERRDHRHHAIDAIVTALTDRSMLNRIARETDKEREKALRVIAPDPWPGFRDDVAAKLEAITVSHKPDHGKEGKLHEETAYGLIKNPDEWDGFNTVYRKPILGLNENEVERIRDPNIRAALRDHLYAAKAAGIKVADAIADFARDWDNGRGIRRIRLMKKEGADYLVPIKDEKGKGYKAYSAGDNLYVEIFETPDGKWQGEGVTVFQANQKGYRPAWRTKHPGARFVMRVHKGDLLRLERDGKQEVMRVYRLDVAANRFKLAPHMAGGSLDKRHSDDGDFFRWLMASYSTLQQMKAEPVRVDELGRVHPLKKVS